MKSLEWSSLPTIEGNACDVIKFKLDMIKFDDISDNVLSDLIEDKSELVRSAAKRRATTYCLCKKSKIYGVSV